MKIIHLIVLAIFVVGGCSRTEQPQASAPRQTAAECPPNLLEESELKKASDVQKHLPNPLKSGQAEQLARTIAEVDEWLIAPNEEKEARKQIDDAVEALRTRITSDVNDLAKKAIAAPNGRDASEKLSKINTLLALYPVPKNEAQRKSLEELSAHVLTTSRRVEDIRRLRYNTWSLEQVRNGMVKFHQQAGGLIWPKQDKDALLKTCTDYVRHLDPGFLEPAAMNLYAEFLRRCDAAMDDDRKVKLASALVDPSLQRRTPSDF
jgi:hypothetical protein